MGEPEAAPEQIRLKCIRKEGFFTVPPEHRVRCVEALWGARNAPGPRRRGPAAAPGARDPGSWSPPGRPGKSAPRAAPRASPGVAPGTLCRPTREHVHEGGFPRDALEAGSPPGL